MTPETRILIYIELKAIAGLNCTLGIDSTIKERNAVRTKINAHLHNIKELDKEFWNEIIPDTRNTEIK